MTVPRVAHGDLSEIHAHWLYWLSTGGVLAALGILCLIVPVTATFATMVVVGASVLVAGVAQMVIAVRDNRWSGSVAYFPVGLIEVGVGAYLLIRPVEAEGPIMLTLLVAFYLALIGILHAGMALAGRFGGWGWLLTAGIVDLALGVLVYLAWFWAGPAPRFWLAGLCVGVSLLCRGLGTAAIATEAHRERGITMRPT